MKILDVQHVSTKINQVALLNDISFSLTKGKILALVGHNGAGKSTLIKSIMGTIEKDTGSINIMEKYDQDNDLLAFKQQLSYLPEEPLLLPELTVMQHFQMYAISYKIPENEFQKRVTLLLDKFELKEKVHVYPEELSKGMRQKVQTICALLPDVAVLLVDEPFMGLDIFAMEYVLNALREKAANGTGIILTTHQLEHVKDLADEFILLKQGKIVDAGPVELFDSITRGYTDE